MNEKKKTKFRAQQLGVVSRVFFQKGLLSGYLRITASRSADKWESDKRRLVAERTGFVDYNEWVGEYVAHFIAL